MKSRYNGAAFTTNKQRIGYTWGSGVSNGSTSSTLNFSVAAGPVTIGGSTTITPGVGSYAGSLGHDANATYQTPSTYDPNRVNAYFVSPHNWIWDGTGSFEGNNGQGLWEEPEIGGGTVNGYFEINSQYLCGAAYGQCSSLN